MTSEVSSHDLRSTRRSRGTEGYRAPELLEEVARYNNKADIWGLGCIVFELFTGARMFVNDFAIFQYISTNRLDLPQLPHRNRAGLLHDLYTQVWQELNVMLSIVPQAAALYLLSIWSEIIGTESMLRSGHMAQSRRTK